MNGGEGLTAGQYLRQERERQNISLESIAQATRISLRNLEALERNDFGAFSASVFARGFLRAYACRIGIDPQKVLQMYEAQTDLVPPERVKKPSSAREKRSTTKLVLLVILLLLAVGIAFSYFFEKPPAPPVPLRPRVSAPPQPSAPFLPPPPEKETPPLMAKAAPAPPASAEEEKKKTERRHVLKVKAEETTWLRVKADDEPPVEVLLQPQETKTWTARRRLDILVGNAGGVDLSFNGVPQKRLGESGEVVHLVLPAKPPAGAEKKED